MAEKRKAKDAAKLEALRAAVQVGFDDLARGDFYEFESADDIDAFFRQLAEEAIAGGPTERRGREG